MLKQCRCKLPCEVSAQHAFQSVSYTHLFLDDNHAFIEIHTGYNPGKTLFVIKDSYANSMIPLLTAHYENIYVAVSYTHLLR